VLINELQQVVGFVQTTPFVNCIGIVASGNNQYKSLVS
jgi:hypothetical protein